jgi:cell division protein FtsI/penicillin-binding protein 2
MKIDDIDENNIDLNINLIKENRKKENRKKYLKYLKFSFIFLIIFSIILFTIIFIIFFNKQNNKNYYYKFRGDEFIFFDPINNNKNSFCNHTNYWTIFNNKTSCFRFVILSINDSNENSFLEILLDHNINFDNYTNALNIIKNLKKIWKNYDNEIYLISEETISKIMKLKVLPNLNGNLTVNGGSEFSRFSLNSEYYINNVEYNFKGFLVE